MTESIWNPREEDGLAWVERRGLGELNNRVELRITEFTVDRAVAQMPVLGNRQPAGLLHGGAYVVMGETLGSFAANFWAGPGRVAVGVDINATHTKSALEGHVTGVCTPIHLGRTMTVHEIVISNEAGQRCSTVRITNLLRDR